MAVPPGIAIGERKGQGTILRAPRSVVLVGAEFAAAVGPALARLLSDHGVMLHVEARPRTTVRDWAGERWLEMLLARCPADLVVVALEPTSPCPAVEQITARAYGAGARVLWLAVPAHAMAEPGLPADILTAGPTATDLAALAALAFRGMGLSGRDNHGARSTHG